MTTAGSDGLCGLGASYRYAGAGAVDVLMPDVRWYGGMLELRKIAAMAEAMDLRVSPHRSASPIAWRARGLADWIDALSLAGVETGLEGSNVRWFATTPPRGQAAGGRSRTVEG